MRKNRFILFVTFLFLLPLFYYYWHGRVQNGGTKNLSDLKTISAEQNKRSEENKLRVGTNAFGFRVLSETLNSTGKVFVVTKNGVTKTAFIPDPVQLTPKQLDEFIFPLPSQESPVGKPSKIKLTKELVFYGIVIDEKSNTVSSAQVEANVLISSPTQSQHREIVWTKSESDGRFELHIPWGQQVMLTVTGETNYISPPPQWFQYGPVGSEPIHHPNISEPIIFKLAKKQVEDSFFQFSRWWGASNNGESIQIDLSTGEAVNQNGDLIVSIFCPEPYSEEKKFPWKLSIQMVNGGLVAAPENQLEFMFLAPENGYEQMLSWEYGPEIKPWKAQHQGTYYLMARNGQFFGKMAFRMNTRWDKRGVPFYTQVIVNTNGSRNLQAP